MEVKELVLKYLKSKKVMQLATVRDGQPWCCNVHFWADDDASLYWLSTEARRHSQEIAEDKRVAAAIAIQTDEQISGTKPIGIQVEGNAEIVTGPDMQTLLRKYFDYHTSKPEQLYQEIIAGKNPHKLYRLKPRLYVLFDVQDYPDEPRQEWRVS